MQTDLIDRPLLPPDIRRRAGDFLPPSRPSVAGRDLPRAAMADILAAYQQRLGNEAGAANAARLREPGTAVIVTGQQAGLATGPLYTVYKAVTAILLARRMAAESGTPVVPVFWNATEDHDLSEIAHCRFPEQEWTAEFPDDGRAAEALPVGPIVADFLPAFLETVGDPQRRAEIRALFPESAADYGELSSGVLARLFADTGLVILEPRLLRPLLVEFFRTAIRRRGEVRSTLAATTARLAASGIEPTIALHQQDTGLFHLDPQGIRRQILDQGDHFLVSGEHREEASVLDEVAAHPERFSTGVYLRPVAQGLLLPHIAFVAGPGEFRYHLQLGQLYELFGAVMPPLHLRNHATVLTAREQRLAEQLGIAPADIERGPEPFRNAVDLPADRAAAIGRARGRIQELVDELEGNIGELVGKKSLKAFASKVHSELGKVEDRATREYRRAMEVDNARVDRFFHAVRPHNVPQERVVNVLYVIQRHGRAFIDALLAAFDPDEDRHYVLQPETD